MFYLMGFVGPTKAALAGELVLDQGLDLIDTTLVWRGHTILPVHVVSLELVHCCERVVIHFVCLKCGRVGVEPVAHRYRYRQDEVGRGGRAGSGEQAVWCRVKRNRLGPEN